MSTKLRVLVLGSEPEPKKAPGTPLPTINSAGCVSRLGQYPDDLTAYRVCLGFERHAMEAESKAKTKTEVVEKQRTIVSARILGYLLLFAPSQTALAEVASTIHSCNEEYDKLLELGSCFLDLFIRPFKQPRTRTPELSDHSSRSSSDMDIKPNIVDGVIAPKDHVGAKETALYRDNFRCAVSGRYDDLAPQFGIDTTGTAMRVGTKCTYIVPELTHSDVEGGINETEVGYAASVYTVLESFGYDVESLIGPKIHSLYNVITMQYDVRGAFEQLYLWFEETETENQYRVVSSRPASDLPEMVTFNSRGDGRCPAPSRELLASHAVCCKIGHMSGAVEYLDDREMENLDAAYDGTSSGILDQAIRDKLSGEMVSSASP